MFALMCKFDFEKNNSNSVLLLTLKFYKNVLLVLHHLYLHSLGKSEYMSGRGIARHFYLNKVFLYIIYLFLAILSSVSFVFFPC